MGCHLHLVMLDVTEHCRIRVKVPILLATAYFSVFFFSFESYFNMFNLSNSVMQHNLLSFIGLCHVQSFANTSHYCNFLPILFFVQMVLAGLRPEIIMEIASRALSFWSYQVIFSFSLHSSL